MNFKKAGYSILLFILIAFVLTLYNSLNGNPISKYTAKKILEKYLDKAYTNQILRITGSGNYDFKFHSYTFKVIKISDSKSKEIDDTYKEYNFTVTGTISQKVQTDPIKEDNIDKTISSKFSEEASKEIQSLLVKELPQVKSVSVDVDVLKGQFGGNMSWSKTLKLDSPLFMHIITDASKESKEDFYKTSEKIQQILNSNSYSYSNVNINGNVIEDGFAEKDAYGYVIYAATFSSSKEIQIKNIKVLKK
jgi:hypothetical protein